MELKRTNRTTTPTVPIKKRRKINWSTIVNLFIVLILVTMLAGGTVGFFYASKVIADGPILNINDFNSLQSSSVYDDEGELIMDIGKELRENLTYSQMPQCVIDAFVSIEDSRYFTHNGFDLPRFTQAAINNLKNLDFGQGGSTFTMQMVKYTYFLQEGEGGAVKSVERKLQEIFIALEADTKLSKKQIFQNYVNKINYGGPARGLQKASKYYFGKGVEEIGLSEAALLAGVINLPNYYNPYYNLDAATIRRNEVLNLMAYHGYISELDYQMAKATKLEDLLIGFETVGDVIPFQSYVDTVITEVEKITGKDPYETPMKIYTAMNRKAQLAIEDAQNGKNKKVKINAHKYLDSALVALNHESEIVVIGGGKNYSGQRVFNKATDMKKQCGSTMKGVLSYPLAFEYLGLTTGSYVDDTPQPYQATSTRIVDFDGKYKGIITVNNALINSRNVPAVSLFTQVTNLLGPEKMIEYMNSIGFTYVTKDTFSVMNALGGGDFATSPLQLAGAYNILMNQGLYREPHTIRLVEYYDGTAPYEPAYTPVQVISEQSTYLTATILQRAVTNGPGASYSVVKKSYPVYAKSGTTDWGGAASRALKLPVSNGNKDKWFTTCTTHHAIAVWVGFDKGIPGANTHYSSSLKAKLIDGNLVKVALDALENGKTKPKGLEKPKGIGSASFIKGYTTHYAPVEGMPSEYITSGMNKNGSTASSTYPIPEIGLFDSVGYNVVEPGGYQVSVTVPEYPDPLLFNVASKNKKFTYGSSSWSGARGNDVTWWMGPVRYYTSIKDPNGTTLFNSGEKFDSTYQISFSDIVGATEGQQLQACSYYAFSKMTDYRSNEVCSPFTYRKPPTTP